MANVIMNDKEILAIDESMQARGDAATTMQGVAKYQTVAELKAELMTDPAFVEDYESVTVGKQVKSLLSYYRRARGRLERLNMKREMFVGLDDYMVEKLSKIFADSLDK